MIEAPWQRLTLAIAALALGAIGYGHITSYYLPWWQWPAELGIACMLLIVALGEALNGDGSAARGGLQRYAAVVCIISLTLAVYWGPQLGAEIDAALAVVVALVAFIAARWLPFDAIAVKQLAGDTSDLPPSGTIDSHFTDRFLPLKKGGQEGFGEWIVQKIPLRPPFSKGEIRNHSAPPHSPAPRSQRLALGLLVGGLLAGVAAIAVNRHDHLAGFVLWSSGVAAFAAAMWMRSGPAPAAPAGAWTKEAGPQVSRRAELAAVAVILVLAIGLRGVMLADYPVQINKDEANHGRMAESLLRNGFPNMFGYAWNAFPNLSFLGTYIGVQTLGPGWANLRAASTLWGVLSLVPFYFWVRRWWGNIIAIVALALLAINHDHIQWSRWGYNNIQHVLVATLLLWSFARALRSRRPVDYVWFAYSIGLCFYTYHAAKLFPVLLAGSVTLFAVGIPGFVARHRSATWIAPVALLLFLGPLLMETYLDWALFWSGTSDRFDFLGLLGGGEGGGQQVRFYFAAHVFNVLMSFVNYPAHEGWIQGPEVCVVFMLGAAWMLWHWRDPRHLVVLLWTVGILVIAGMMTVAPPNKPRMIGFLPTVCLITAVIAGRLRGLLWRTLGERADIIGIPLVVAWLGASLYQNWHTEFVYIPWEDRGNAGSEMARIIARTPLPATLYMAGVESSGFILAAAESISMLPRDPERVLVHLADDPMIAPLRPTHRGNAAIVIAPNQRALVDLVQHYYPGARHDVLYDFTEKPALDTFTLSAGDAERSRGLIATYHSQRGTWVAPEGRDRLSADQETVFPVRVSGKGLVWISPPGLYGLRSPGGSVELDGRSIDASQRRWLAAGWHLLGVDGTLQQAEESLTVEWSRPDTAPWSTLPRAFLFAHNELHGLLGRYFAQDLRPGTAEPIAAQPTYTQIEPALSFDWSPDVDESPPPAFAARPSTMEWSGTVRAPKSGVPRLRLETTGPAEVFIDGKQVLQTPGNDAATALEAVLDDVAETASILVRAVRPVNDPVVYWRFHLTWATSIDTWTAFAQYEPPADDKQLDPRPR
jgi:hypothetical protein